jgi:hypothetical protein
MVDRKISGDASLPAGSIAGGDLVPVVDISEPADADKNKNISFTILETYLNSNLNFNNYSHPNHSGHVSSSGDGATTLLVAAITGQTELASGLVGTDELLVSDGGVIKRMDVSVMNAYFNANLNFNNYVHPSYTARTESGDTGPLTGATVISDLDFNFSSDTQGHVTAMDITTLATRELTPGDIGAATSGHNHSGVYEPVDATILRQADVDDIPVNGVTQYPISSNWAFDHQGGNEHIDWTNTSSNFLTTGTVKGGTIYAGNPTLTVDDQFYLGALTTTTARVNFDANDLIQYDRTANQFLFIIGAVEEFTLNGSTADFQGNLITTTGDGNFDGIVYAGNTTLTTDDQFYLGALIATVPRLNFDNADILEYDRTANQFNFVIGGSNEFTLNTTLADFQDNDIQTTGSIEGATLALSTAYNGVTKTTNNNALYISGSNTVIEGANAFFCGESHPTSPYDIVFRSASVYELQFDYSANTWDFNANDLLIDEIRIAYATKGIHLTVNDDVFRISGGDLVTNGANLRLYGQSHSTKAYDIDLYAGPASSVLSLDYSALTWTVGNGINFVTAASIAARAGLRLPHGTAPTSPVNGDVWTTTSSIFARINGATVDLGGGGEALWQEQNTSITGTKGSRYVKASGASHTITLPTTPKVTDDPNFVAVWNNDTDTSTVTVDPNGTNSLYLRGENLGAGVAVVLQPGEAVLCVGRQTSGTAWDVMYIHGQCHIRRRNHYRQCWADNRQHIQDRRSNFIHSLYSVRYTRLLRI